MGKLRARPELLVLAGFVGASVGLRFWAAYRVPGLWIAPDEMIYGSLGRSLWESGTLRIFGGPPAIYSVVYPALIGAPLAFLGADAGYVVAKAVQAVAMSLTAVPVYLWARSVARPAWALVAAALTLALPALVYTGLLMTEVAFFPALVLAAWAIAAAIERPTAARQALLVGAIVVAVGTRLQALVLVPAVLTALALDAALARDIRRPLRLWPALVAIGGLAAGWVGWRAAVGGGLDAALGSYSAAAGSHYGFGDAGRFVAYHAADVLLVTGLFPVCAVALLLWEGLRGRPGPPALRPYLASACAVTGWIVLEVGVFASENVGRLAERDLVAVAPLLFVGFAVWLDRGAPRPRLPAGAVVLAALALFVALPLDRMVVEAAVPDAFALVPLLWLREQTSLSTLELVAWVGAAGALVLFALLPRRLVAALPAIVAGVLVYSSVAASVEVAQDSRFDQRYLLGGQRGWVDAAAREPVGYLYAGEPYWNAVPQTLFWNSRIRHVYVLKGVKRELGLPETIVRVAPSGRLVRPDGNSIPERLLVGANGLELRGTRIAAIREQFVGQTGLTLWRPIRPPRLLSMLTQVRENGDIYAPAKMTVWECQEGQLQLTLLPKLSSRVALLVNGRTQRIVRLHSGPVNETVYPPPGARRCAFVVAPDNLLGSTHFAFVRR